MESGLGLCTFYRTFDEMCIAIELPATVSLKRKAKQHFTTCCYGVLGIGMPLPTLRYALKLEWGQRLRPEARNPTSQSYCNRSGPGDKPTLSPGLRAITQVLASLTVARLAWVR